jgi:hypothetical protein
VIRPTSADTSRSSRDGPGTEACPGRRWAAGIGDRSDHRVAGRPSGNCLHATVMTNRDFLKGPQDHTTGRQTARIRAGPLLVVLRRHQIPCSIDSLSANGWTARLGDPSKGPYSQQGYFRTLDAAAEWLLEEAERRGVVAVIGDRQSRRPVT